MQDSVNPNITMGEVSVSEDRNHPQLLRISIYKWHHVQIYINRSHYKWDKIKFNVFLGVYFNKRFMINSAINYIAKFRDDYFHPILLHISWNSFSFVNFKCYDHETKNIVTLSSLIFSKLTSKVTGEKLEMIEKSQITPDIWKKNLVEPIICIDRII